VYSSPAIGSDGTVYVGSTNAKVYALDGKTGAKKWEFEKNVALRQIKCLFSPLLGESSLF